ncbi:MAG: response regulator [Planctomycetota bacterium]|nr:MAG: response regulator [Planctomycetota bacterium]
MNHATEKNVLLFVDDEANILAALKRVFRKSGYEIHTASSGQEGLEILEQLPVDLVMSDQRMPGMTGVEFLKKVKELYPHTIRIILSGYSEIGTITSAINEGEVFRFVSKPWNDEELKQTIEHSLEQRKLRKQNELLLKKVSEQNEKLRILNEDLERLVRERTGELAMTQKILENLPVSVIGVDEEKTVAYVNKAAREIWRDKGIPLMGVTVGRVFDESVEDIVEQARTEGRLCGLDEFVLGEKKLRIACKVVDPEDKGRGVILLVEEKTNDRGKITGTRPIA